MAISFIQSVMISPRYCFTPFVASLRPDASVGTIQFATTSSRYSAGFPLWHFSNLFTSQSCNRVCDRRFDGPMSNGYPGYKHRPYNGHHEYSNSYMNPIRIILQPLLHN